MGGNKALMQDYEELEADARRLLRAVGALGYCEYHGVYFDGGADKDGAYRLGNAKVTRGELDLRGFSRKDLTDAIDAQYLENSGNSECPRCHDNEMD